MFDHISLLDESLCKQASEIQKSKSTKELIDFCDYALEKVPHSPGIRYFKVLTFLSLGKFTDCIKESNLIKEYLGNEYHPLVLFVEAEVKRLIGDPIGAIRKLDLVIQYAVSNRNRSNALVLKGNLLKKINERKEVTNILIESIEADDQNPAAYESLGFHYSWTEHMYQESICCYRILEVLLQDNFSPKFSWVLAYLYDNWDVCQKMDPDFFLFKGPHENVITDSVNERAFLDKVKLSRTYLAKTFITSTDLLRTDLLNEPEVIKATLFQSPKWGISTIEEKSFFFADISMFNDLTDCPLLHSLNQTDLIQSLTKDHVRVRCLSQAGNMNDQYKMWAEYANAHTGIAIQLDINRDWIFEKGIYSGIVNYTPFEELEISLESPEQVIIDGLFSKHLDHSIEDERRLVVFGSFSNGIGEKVFWSYPDSSREGVVVKRVFLGARVTQETKNRVLVLAELNKFDVWQMELGSNGSLKSYRVER